MGKDRSITENEVKGFIQVVDKSGDGKIQKIELLEIFKRVVNG
jgi:Ca2+-binding EF-hand superfamily protein